MEIELEKIDVAKSFLSNRNKRYARDKAKIVYTSYLILEDRFGIPLTLGQKMIVRQRVYDSIDDHGAITRIDHSFEPSQEAAVRFVLEYYSGLPSEIIRYIASDVASERERKEFIARNKNYE